MLLIFFPYKVVLEFHNYWDVCFLNGGNEKAALINLNDVFYFSGGLDLTNSSNTDLNLNSSAELQLMLFSID